jgi:acyl carrier protein
MTRSLAEVTQFICQSIACHARLPPEMVESGVSFDEFGLDSLIVATVAAEVSEYLGREVMPSEFARHTTPIALATALCS